MNDLLPAPCAGMARCLWDLVLRQVKMLICFFLYISKQRSNENTFLHMHSLTKPLMFLKEIWLFDLTKWCVDIHIFCFTVAWGQVCFIVTRHTKLTVSMSLMNWKFCVRGLAYFKCMYALVSVDWAFKHSSETTWSLPSVQKVWQKSSILYMICGYYIAPLLSLIILPCPGQHSV